jgi:hypothetical protein
VKIRLRGKGDMKVHVRYENVSFFCFICGRIGHSDKDWPDGEVEDGAFNYGVELRASPPKHLREVRVQTRPMAAQFLNFEGDQKARLQDETSSSWRRDNPSEQGGRRQWGGGLEEEGDQVNSIPHNEEKEFMQGIEVIEEGSQGELLPIYGPDGMQQRVSLGTNMMSKGEPSVGVLPQHTVSVAPKTRIDDQELSLMKHAGPSRNNDKQKKRRMSPYSRSKRHGGDGCASDSGMVEALSRGVNLDDSGGDQGMLDEGLGFTALPSSAADPTPLTGHQDEARQER